MKNNTRLTRSKFLTDAEMTALHASIANADKRDRLMIELALATGARAQELLNINIADLSLEQHAVHIKGLKGSDDREIPLPDKLWADVLELAAGRIGLLFNIKYRRLEQIWRIYRPCDKKFHSLRHTFALSLYKRSNNIHLVKTALGHRNISNTMIYLDYVESTEELRAYLVKAV